MAGEQTFRWKLRSGSSFTPAQRHPDPRSAHPKHVHQAAGKITHHAAAHVCVCVCWCVIARGRESLSLSGARAAEGCAQKLTDKPAWDNMDKLPKGQVGAWSGLLPPPPPPPPPAVGSSESAWNKMGNLVGKSVVGT